VRKISLLSFDLIFNPILERLGQLLIKDHIEHFDVFERIQGRVLKDKNLVDQRLVKPGEEKRDFTGCLLI
jgi:hypothetical protein